MDRTYIFASARNAFVTTLVFALLGTLTFFAFEPSVGRTQEVFTVSQTITDEVSFLVAPADVTMIGSIQGLTGGYATGSTMAVVSTNDPQGYNMTLQFSSTTAMKLNNGTSTISNYTPNATSAPDYDWITNGSGASAEFGYTVRASTTGEVDPSFRNDGSSCNTGSNETENKCWFNPTSTVAEVIMNTSAPVVSSTSTIKFKVAVPSNPSPSLVAGIYIATGTLTISGNP